MNLLIKREIHTATVRTAFCGNRHPVTERRANLQMNPDSLEKLFR